MFLDPTETALRGYVVDPITGGKAEKELLQLEEHVLYAELDLDKAIEWKQYHDVVGGYQRLHIFDSKVDRRRKEPANFIDHDSDHEVKL